MKTFRNTTYLVALIGSLASVPSGHVWAQQKYQVTRSPSSSSQYVQQHAIDVDDVAAHQIRVYEIRSEYPKKDFSFAGIPVMHSLTRGISDYVGLSGPFTTYTVYTLEDGSKIFSRGAGTSLLTTGPSGNSVLKFSAVDNYVGGTGRFKGIRGQVQISGERDMAAKSVTQQSTGEYWIED